MFSLFPFPFFTKIRTKRELETQNLREINAFMTFILIFEMLSIVFLWFWWFEKLRIFQKFKKIIWKTLNLIYGRTHFKNHLQTQMSMFILEMVYNNKMKRFFLQYIMNHEGSHEFLFKIRCFQKHIILFSACMRSHCKRKIFGL